MIKVAEGQKVKLEEGRFATIASEGTLILEYTGEGPLGQERVRTVGISTVGAHALLDLLANGEAVEHSVHPTIDNVPPCPECGQRHTWKHMPAVSG
jgi:hypothetical protein